MSRRPARSLLTLAAISTVVLLALVVTGFIRGMERSLAVSGDPSVVLVYSLGAEENIENSAVPARIPGLLTASINGVQRRFGIPHVSPELYLGGRIQTGRSSENAFGLIRGITSTAPLVRRKVRLTDGTWPRLGEVIVGKLVAAKIGCAPDELAIGKEISFEKQQWRISGHFSAEGSAFESEIWCPLLDLQRALKRQDLSVVAMLLLPETNPREIELFCKERTDLELQAVGELEYYRSVQKHYRPLRILAWTVVLLVSGAGIFAGLNLMYGAVAGRVREIATLQAVGYRRRAILVSLIHEGTLLAAAGSLLGATIAILLFHGQPVRFTMGAFTLSIDGTALFVGCGVGILIGVLGTIPAAIRALRLPIAESLNAY